MNANILHPGFQGRQLFSQIGSKFSHRTNTSIKQHVTFKTHSTLLYLLTLSLSKPINFFIKLLFIQTIN